jgi:hypothetical protein
VSAITTDQAEWALIDRLGRLLAAPPSEDWSTTETYALFTATLCWVVQHCRTSTITKGADKAAQTLWSNLSGVQIADDPWNVHVAQTEREVEIDGRAIMIPAPNGLETLTVADFAVHLRNATAHANAHRVEAFNQHDLLLGFTFAGTGSDAIKSTLLQSDMQRIGGQLARHYCDALKSVDNAIDQHADLIMEAAE